MKILRPPRSVKNLSGTGRFPSSGLFVCVSKAIPIVSRRMVVNRDHSSTFCLMIQYSFSAAILGGVGFVHSINFSHRMRYQEAWQHMPKANVFGF